MLFSFSNAGMCLHIYIHECTQFVCPLSGHWIHTLALNNCYILFELLAVT